MFWRLGAGEEVWRDVFFESYFNTARGLILGCVMTICKHNHWYLLTQRLPQPKVTLSFWRTEKRLKERNNQVMAELLEAWVHENRRQLLRLRSTRKTVGRVGVSLHKLPEHEFGGIFTLKRPSTFFALICFD